MEFSEKIFSDENYRHYMAIYNSNLLKLDKTFQSYYITIISKEYAIISCTIDITYEELRVKTKEFLDFIEKTNLYTLQSVKPSDSSGVSAIQNLETLDLKGNGVLVGIVDTGINYLNKGFLDKDNNTRIACIWDQTVASDKKTINDNIMVPFGSLYESIDINNAIRVFNEGGNNYEIVPSKDEFGHGTKMAYIIGGKGESIEKRGIAPECDLAIVKLIESADFKKELSVKEPLYNLIAIFSAIQFLLDFALKKNKPLVIYLPIGSNFSNHKGDTLLENYIDTISINRGVVVITGTGNEGDTKSHTSGILEFNGDTSDIGIYVDPLQENMAVQIWVSKPNIMSVNIISPSGEETGIIPGFLNLREDARFIFENTRVSIKYYIPEESSGDELIEIYFTKIKSGTWKIRMIGNWIIDGRFDAWIPQKGIAFGETKFIYSDPYGTLTSPGPSTYIINVACYDQTRDYIVNSSGRSFENDVIDRVDIAAGGVNVTTSDISGEGYSVVNGTSVSAAVVAGACALLMQWGIVDGKSDDMYSQKIKAFLIRGTEKRAGDIYPNPELGYGILDLVGVFKNMT